MAFKLRSQGIDMAPTEGRFVDLGMLGNVIGDEIKFLCPNGKRLGLDLMEGHIRGNIGCREQFEDLSRLLQVLVVSSRCSYTWSFAPLSHYRYTVGLITLLIKWSWSR